MRLLVGLDLKALVGFTNDHVEVTEISEQEFDLRDTTLGHLGILQTSRRRD